MFKVNVVIKIIGTCFNKLLDTDIQVAEERYSSKW